MASESEETVTGNGGDGIEKRDEAPPPPPPLEQRNALLHPSMNDVIKLASTLAALDGFKGTPGWPEGGSPADKAAFVIKHWPDTHTPDRAGGSAAKEACYESLVASRHLPALPKGPICPQCHGSPVARPTDGMLYCPTCRPDLAPPPPPPEPEPVVEPEIETQPEIPVEVASAEEARGLGTTALEHEAVAPPVEAATADDAAKSPGLEHEEIHDEPNDDGDGEPDEGS